MGKFDYVKHSTRCEFAKKQQQLTDEDRNDLQAALQTPTIPIAHIMRVLNQLGVYAGETTLRTHRRGDCQTCSSN
jgi:hypothetical protein